MAATVSEWSELFRRPEFEAFHRAMLANPDDDLPRLVFADWLEENGPDPAVAAAVRVSLTHPRRREEWPDLPTGRSWNLTFERGRLVATVLRPSDPGELFEAVWRAGWVETANFLARSEVGVRRWFEDPGMAAVRSVTVADWHPTPVDLRPLLASPHLGRLESLTLHHWVMNPPVSVRALVRAETVAPLTRLKCDCCLLAPDGVRALAESPWAARLRTLSFVGGTLDPDWAEAVAASPHLSGLTALRVEGTFPSSPSPVTDAAAATLANSPHLSESVRSAWRRG